MRRSVAASKLPLVLVLFVLAAAGLPFRAGAQAPPSYGAQASRSLASSDALELAEPDGRDDVDQGKDAGPSTEAANNPAGLGARFNADGSATFRVFSSRATYIRVYLYKTSYGAQETAFYMMTKDATTNLWSRSVTATQLASAVGTNATTGALNPVYYGYRAWGPNWTYNSTWTKGSSLGFVSDVDSQGNRFNPNKLLLDPYALEVTHDPTTPSNTNGTVYASGPTYRLVDSGAKAPKGVVLKSDATSFGTKPTRALKDDVVYEVHVKGLSANDTSISASYRGTYKGAGLEATRLKSLGVTAVEFLPVQESQNDTNDVDPATDAGDNYWGYSTLNFFAPDRRYAYDKSPGGPTKEWKAMVAAFHAQGIKVFVDVVYNHTGEGYLWNNTDPTTVNIQSFRGLDNPTYYELTTDNQYYWDDTGCGGNFNCHNPTTQQLILDSLGYWKDSLGCDGFRFDLAPVVGNICEKGCYSFNKLDPSSTLHQIWLNLSPRAASGGAGVDLISESWTATGDQELGNFPDGWSEWNGAFRDAVRASQNKLGVEAVTPGTLARRFAGSDDFFGDDGRKPWNSINFLTAHDGFTLADLYRYNTKNNGQAWPWGPSDGGTDDNKSWDQGGVAADQRKAARNGMALLLLSAGTPMFVGGDEFLRTQQGNNNAYNVDSSAMWLGYTWTADQQNFYNFTKALAAFRNAHPALRPVDWYKSTDTNGNVMEQLRWLVPSPANQVPTSTYWNDPNNRAFAWRIDGTELGDTASAIYVAYNGWSGDVTFQLPWPGNGKSWYRVTDTATWAEGPSQVRAPGAEDFVGGEYYNYTLKGRSVLLLIAK